MYFPIRSDIHSKDPTRATRSQGRLPLVIIGGLRGCTYPDQARAGTVTTYLRTMPRLRLVFRTELGRSREGLINRDLQRNYVITLGMYIISCNNIG